MRGRCECGCGRPTNIADKDRPDLGWRKGEPIRFINGHSGVLGAAAANRDYADGDSRAIAYYTGAADARNGRARRRLTTDTSMIGDAYTRGYNSLRSAS